MLRNAIPREESPLLARLCDDCRADLLGERFERERCACGYVNPCAPMSWELIHSREIPVQVRRMSEPWQKYFAMMVEVGRYAGEGVAVARQWAYAALMQRRRAAEKKVQVGA